MEIQFKIIDLQYEENYYKRIGRNIFHKYYYCTCVLQKNLYVFTYKLGKRVLKTNFPRGAHACVTVRTGYVRAVRGYENL